MVEHFCNLLESAENPWGKVPFAREFNYLRGKTDVVAISDTREILAFEMKLEKWQTALHQAYRNKCFAHVSYVVLPKETALRAQRYPHEFAKRSVGLCMIDGSDITLIYRAESAPPIQPWLSAAAETKVMRECKHGQSTRPRRCRKKSLP